MDTNDYPIQAKIQSLQHRFDAVINAANSISRRKAFLEKIKRRNVELEQMIKSEHEIFLERKQALEQQILLKKEQQAQKPVEDNNSTHAPVAIQESKERQADVSAHVDVLQSALTTGQPSANSDAGDTPSYQQTSHISARLDTAQLQQNINSIFEHDESHQDASQPDNKQTPEENTSSQEILQSPQNDSEKQIVRSIADANSSQCSLSTLSIGKIVPLSSQPPQQEDKLIFSYSVAESVRYADQHVYQQQLPEKSASHVGEMTYKEMPQLACSLIFQENSCSEQHDFQRIQTDKSMPMKASKLSLNSSKLLLLTEQFSFIQRLQQLQQLKFGDIASDGLIMHQFTLLAQSGAPAVIGYNALHSPPCILPHSFEIRRKVMNFRGFPGVFTGVLVHVPECTLRVNLARCGLSEAVILCGHRLAVLDVSNNPRISVKVLGDVKKVISECATAVKILG